MIQILHSDFKLQQDIYEILVKGLVAICKRNPYSKWSNLENTGSELYLVPGWNGCYHYLLLG